MSYRFGFSSAAFRRAAIVAWVFLGAAAFGCAFPDHYFTDEKCLNGIDDDGNGLIDCEDPGCSPIAKCIEPVPTGWVGPVAIWQGAGSDTPPDCSESKYPGTSFSKLFKDPNNVGVGLETCPTCSCGGSTDSGAIKCLARLQGSSSLQCGGERQLLKDNSDGQFGYPVSSDCTTVTFDTTQFQPQTMFFTEPYAVNPGCVSQSTGSTNIPEATFGNSLRACKYTETEPGGCGVAQKCVPRPKGAFRSLACIYQESSAGAASCPQPFTDESLVYSEYLEGRFCSECSCKPSNVTCSAPGSGTYYDDSFCTTTPRGIPMAGACTSTQGLTTVYATISSTPTVSGTSNCAAVGGAVEGGVSPLHSYTFCCVSVQ